MVGINETTVTISVEDASALRAQFKEINEHYDKIKECTKQVGESVAAIATLLNSLMAPEIKVESALIYNTNQILKVLTRIEHNTSRCHP